ncbi:MAG: hypothetical protein A3D93_05295 [Acidobacteria bacterium RIFCSPHIGHO2_12_FULL_67_30]|nr:MAG: hypothetical protein A3B65_00020 [Acidobacteria bacterium RIFCSPHIGHO2_02_FULL_67_57]OFV86079.1 MAG: hypothetical protein A2620_06475 [Acidobacteria bacterium RIFCSPHIGHO2_01_FULL_67_28]OFV89395.1 MAG: hypothetical protein A3D93_05295 [Acidobacteria bacterium RIFCSPHIGHO2_12_FULL_67_30]
MEGAVRSNTRGFSLIELLIVVAIILIIAAIAIPNLLKSRMAANESATVGNMKTIGTALATYTSIYGTCGYPDSLTRLGPGTPPTPAAAGLLDAVMANDNFNKQGYVYTYALTNGAGDCVGAPGADFELEAQPSVQNKTGIRGFFMDSSMVIRYDPDGDADISSPTV